VPGLHPLGRHGDLVGRLDGIKDAGVIRDSAGKFVSANGYGNMNVDTARLVLQAVSDVASHEIDYSKTVPPQKMIPHANHQQEIR
jgi:hypothetical protein